ncbi:Metallo-dependent phosphatase [Xylariaceae sp. FL0594]|nr:Metallo-dependent phosphatase [Xylariaceae sp. FL0594]
MVVLQMPEDDTIPRAPRRRGSNVIGAVVLLACTTILLLLFFFISPLGPGSSVEVACRPFHIFFSRPETMTDYTTTTARPRKDAKKSYPHLSTLPPSLLPSPNDDKQREKRRVIIIGDVHGHLRALKALLEKVDFARERDTVVFTGDMVNKGADSAGVVDLAMRIGAFGVRGNHEHRVLGAWLKERQRRRRKHQKDKKKEKERKRKGSYQHDGGLRTEGQEDGIQQSLLATETSNLTLHDEELVEKEEGGGGGDIDAESISSVSASAAENENQIDDADLFEAVSKTHAGDYATAASLKPQHRAWLSELPLILRLGDLGPRYAGDVVVVHAGLVPGVALEEQDPGAVMNVRTLLPPSSSRRPSQAQSNVDINQNQNQNPLSSSSDDQPQLILIPTPTREGVPWAKLWNAHQKRALSRRRKGEGERKTATTVVYGHDAKAGLRMRRYAFGLDSGCGNGHALTALVFELDTPTSASAHSKKEAGPNQQDGESSASSEYEDDDDDEHELILVDEDEGEVNEEGDDDDDSQAQAQVEEEESDKIPDEHRRRHTQDENEKQDHKKKKKKMEKKHKKDKNHPRIKHRLVTVSCHDA